MNRKLRRATESAKAGVTAAFLDVFNAALAAQQAGKLDEAEAGYRKAMALNPNVALVYNNLGVLMYSRGKHEDAIALQKKAQALDPRNSMSFNNMGVALNKLERLPEALAAFEQAMKLAPDDPEPLNNYGETLSKLSRFAEGEAVLRRVLAARPNHIEAHTNMGTALWGLGRLDEAADSFRRVIALKPDVAMAHKNLGMVLLLQGHLAQGWREYDWRWLADSIPLRQYPCPVWTGAPLGDGALFVWAEQGVGDEILHLSMLADLLARGIKLIWEVDERLVPLVQRTYPGARIIPRRSPTALDFAGVAAHLPAGSLGQVFRADMAHFPRGRRGYLEPDRARSAALRAALNLAPGEKLIGLSWLSTNIKFAASKSTKLADWAPLIATPGVRFVDLQYGDTSAERAALARDHGVTLHHVDGLDLKADIDGVAALAAACDLVITVSNTTAHIAGAIGAPGWVMIPAGIGKFWYWGFDAATSPWYPSLSLLRQADDQDWSPILADIKNRLKSLVGR
ncbi:MAG: tetratricopeptide repeat protein [Rhodospirillaceae bacterium]|nr:tetratricopeptide repeat protein [Rhodospirillaceae bacterium]